MAACAPSLGERASVVLCESSDQDVMTLVGGLVDGEAIVLVGQLLATRTKFGLWVRVKVTSAAPWAKHEIRPD